MSEPAWLTIARSYIGLAEIPGKETNPTIRNWLIRLGAWWRDDETPWCGTFVGAVMQEAGLPIPRHYYRARAWLECGTELTEPSLGCIAVFDRRGGGHVGLVVGRAANFDDLLVLGGNQGNRVSIAAFPRERVLGYRWPVTTEQRQPLAILTQVSRSTSEA